MMKTAAKQQINWLFPAKQILFHFSFFSSFCSRQSQSSSKPIIAHKLSSPLSNSEGNRRLKIQKPLQEINLNCRNKYPKLLSRVNYHFTSSSNPTQVPLLEEVEAKVLQIIKKWKPSIFIEDLSASSHDSRSQNEEIKVDQMKLNSGFRKIDRNIPFERLGFDSLDVTQMIIAMEQSFGIQLSDEEALKITSISNAIDIFFTKMNARVMNKLVEKLSYNNGIVRKQI